MSFAFEVLVCAASVASVAQKPHPLPGIRVGIRIQFPIPSLQLPEMGAEKWETGNGRRKIGDGRWEMGDGSWEMGDGRWDMGDGKGEMCNGRRKRWQMGAGGIRGDGGW